MVDIPLTHYLVPEVVLPSKVSKSENALTMLQPFQEGRQGRLI